MSDRPKLSIPRTPAARALQGVAVVGIAAMFVFCASVWSRLPQTVPTHFGASGQPDGWGGRGTLLVLPVLVVLFYCGLSFLERFPHTYNYPVSVTERNARQLYVLGRQLVLELKLIVIATFGFIFYASVQGALGGRGDLSPWFLPLVLGAVMATFAVTLARMKRAKAV